jgi:drug/metabolite transporter (DMT)-like permease
MTPTASLLILISALAHAFWNFLGKRSHPTAAYFLAASLCAVILFLPLLFFYRNVPPQIPPVIWLLLALTGCCQAFYYSSLAAAYRSGDLSLVYPLVRAIPIPLVAIASMALGRGQQITTLGLLGMGLVAIGCILVPLRDLKPGKQTPSQRVQPRTLALSCMAALGTTGYLLIDDAALRNLRAAGIPGLSPLSLVLIYMGLEIFATVLALAIYVLMNRRERQAWTQVTSTGLKPAIVSGIVINGGYLLVLVAMTLARDVSYVTAFRQVSIPIGALMGIWILKEPSYPLKLVGIATIFSGLFLVAWGSRL